MPWRNYASRKWGCWPSKETKKSFYFYYQPYSKSIGDRFIIAVDAKPHLIIKLELRAASFDVLIEFSTKPSRRSQFTQRKKRSRRIRQFSSLEIKRKIHSRISRNIRDLFASFSLRIFFLFVTIENHYLTAVQPTKHSEDEKLCNKKIETFEMKNSFRISFGVLSCESPFKPWFQSHLINYIKRSASRWRRCFRD